MGADFDSYKASIVLLSSCISTAPQEQSPERAGVCSFAALHNLECSLCTVRTRGTRFPPISGPLRPTVHNFLIAVWMSVSASDAAGKFAAIFLPISAFVAMGLDHSVANM